MTLWVVKGGRAGEREDRFLDHSVVGVGWEEIADLDTFADRDALKGAYRVAYPGESEGRVGIQVGQLWALSHTMRDGDLVVVPLKTRGQIAVGRVSGPYRHTNEYGSDMVHVRPVKWIRKDFPRTAFDQDLRYGFGAYLGVSTVSRNNAESRVEAIVSGQPAPQPSIPTTPVGPETQAEHSEIDLEDTGREQITDLIERRFKGHDLGRLVDAILRAQGLFTRVSPPGPDGGVDIVAGGGSFGLEDPHMVVQVKSQVGPADVVILRELKSALGDYRADQGLLVCWGGFKDTLKREARNDYFKIRLWDRLDLLNAIFQYYDRFEEDLKAELPLKRIWTVAREELDA